MERGQRLEAINPADLLSFFGAAAAVAHRDLEYRHLQQAELCGDLGAKLEACTLQIELSQKLGAKDLETGRLVGQEMAE